MTSPIPEKILLLLEYLKKYQCPDGSFESNTAFYSYLIPLTCATVSHLYDTDPIILPALSFIESQFDPDLSINYWKQGSHQATSSPLPNDLDDTFTALSALAVHGKIFTPSELSRSITLLVSNEVSIGGPYYTWHVSSGERMNWENLDPVVNSIILFFSLPARNSPA
jgi:hypothetical protein